MIFLCSLPPSPLLCFFNLVLVPAEAEPNEKHLLHIPAHQQLSLFTPCSPASPASVHACLLPPSCFLVFYADLGLVTSVRSLLKNDFCLADASLSPAVFCSYRSISIWTLHQAFRTEEDSWMKVECLQPSINKSS